MKRFLAVISIVLVGIFVLQGCKVGKGTLNKISDIEMTLAEGESEVSVNLLDYVRLPKGKDIDFDTLDISVVEQGDYGTFVVTGEILTYLRTVQTDANDTGVLGVSDGINSVQVDVTVITEGTPGVAVWKQVVGGRWHTVGIKYDGTLWAWGRNSGGQLGDGTQIERWTPVQEVTGATDWVSVSAGGEYTVAIKSDGTLWAWGANNYGEIGDGTIFRRLVPTQEITEATDWSFVSAGWGHTVAIKSDGTLWAWGMNWHGELGDGTEIDRWTPVQEITGATDWSFVNAGCYGFTVAIKTDGTLWAWGDNSYGKLGDGTTVNKNVPTQEITGATDWSFVSAGYDNTIAIKSDGTLWAWGANLYGQIGDGTTVSKSVPTQEITGATDWSFVSAGYDNTIAIKSDGTLWGWGYNNVGQIGDGTTVSKSVPTQEITEATDWGIVSAGWEHTIAIKSNHTLWAWGSNYYGQLGDGTNDDSLIPIEP